MVEILIFLVFLIQTLICTNEDPSVMCVFRQNCILPCNVDPSSDTVIHWNYITSGHNVHSYYDGQDQLGRQDQQFKGRTSLFHDRISRGNGSLKLTGVKIQDEGRFICYSSTERGSKKIFIQLKVEALITEVIIEQKENRIICSSEGIYPQPELTWSTEPPSNTALQNRTTVHQTEEKLYDISSSLLVSDSHYDQTYSCTVSSGRNRKIVSLPRKKVSFRKGKKVMDAGVAIGIMIGGYALWILIFVIILGVCCDRMMNHRAGHQD